LFTEKVVNRFIETGLDDKKPNTKGTYRSALRRRGKRINKRGGWEPQGKQLARVHTKPPYTTAEVAILRQLPSVQSTELRRDRLATVIGLGLGAGLDGRDLPGLTAANITTTETGMTVRVTRKGRERTVPVLPGYRSLVAHALKLDPGTTIVPNGDNAVGNLFRNAHSDKIIIQASRLRSTWIVAQLNRQIPLPVLLRAAALRSARVVTDLLEYLDGYDAAESIEWLSGGNPG
jgi:integrase